MKGPDMARVVFDGKYKVYLVDEIADRDAPTDSELSGADDITKLCPKDWLDLGRTQGRVNAGDISTVFSAELAGTWSLQASSTHFLDDEDAENTAWTTIQHGVRKDVVVLWSATDTSPEDGDAAYVFPVEFGVAIPTNPAENEQQRFEVDWMMYEEPVLDATVASGA